MLNTPMVKCCLHYFCDEKEFPNYNNYNIVRHIVFISESTL